MGETGFVLCEEAIEGDSVSEVKTGELASDRITLLALLIVRILGGGRASS